MRSQYSAAEADASDGYRRILLIAALDLLLASLAAAVGLLVIFGGALSAASPDGNLQDLMIGGTYVTLRMDHQIDVSCSDSVAHTEGAAGNRGFEYQFVIRDGISSFTCQSQTQSPLEVAVFIEFANDEPIDYRLHCQSTDHRLLAIYTRRGIPSDRRWIQSCKREKVDP